MVQMSLDRRLSRLEKTSFLGSQAELDECEFLFMRVPEGYQADPQYEKSYALARKLGKQLICLDSPAAHSLPLWALTPLDRLSDELLDEQVNELERRIAAAQSPTTGEHQNEQATQ
jgi:hypothetical protein